MRRAILIILLFLTSFVEAQQVLLPVVKNNVWQIVDTNGRIVRSTTYSYINTFDSKGFTFFHEKGGYGILDSQGKEIVPPTFTDAKQFGNGRFALKSPKGWVEFLGGIDDEVSSESIQMFDEVNDYWMYKGSRDSIFLQNLVNGLTLKIEDVGNVKFLHNHVQFTDKDNNSTIYNHLGEAVLTANNLSVQLRNTLVYAQSGGLHYIFDESGAWDIPGAESVLIDNETVFVKFPKTGTLYSHSKKKLLTGNFEEAYDFDQRFYLTRSSGKVTLIEKVTGKRFAAGKYSDITKAGTDNYYVYNDGNTGYTDQNLNIIIPCKYTRFAINNDLAYVYDESFYGLYSLKSKKEIIPPNYSKITEVSDNRFKAYRGEILQLFEIDKNHNLTKRVSLSNVVEVWQETSFKRKRKVIDERLFSLGWFLDSTLVNTKDESFYALKWGLRNPGDSILIKPSLSDLIFVPGAPFTIENRKKQEFRISDLKTVPIPWFRAINYVNGKNYHKYNIVDYASRDWLSRSYMRFSTATEFGIFRGDGTVEEFAYIGNSKYPRYCKAKEVKGTEQKVPDMTEVPDLFLEALGSFKPLEVKNEKMKFEGAVFPDGEWNFLDIDGRRLLADTFSFAHEFVGNQAIVRKGKTWGLVNPDSVIVPTIFSSVERKYFRNDTLFIAKSNRTGSRYLDTSVRIVPLGNMIRSDRGRMLFEAGKEKWIADETGKKIIEGHTNYKFLKNGFILGKNKKEFSVFDGDGTLLFDNGEEPEFYIGNQYAVVRKGRSLALINTSNDVVLEGNSSIEQFGKFIVRKKEGVTTIFSMEIQPLKEKVKGNILFDTIGNSFAVFDNGQVQVFDESGKRKAKIKNLRANYFHTDRFIVSRGDSAGVFDINGNRVLKFTADMSELKVFADGYFFLKMSGEKGKLFNANWEEMLPDQTFRNIIYLGENTFAFSSAMGLMICNAVSGVSENNCLEISGKFEEKRLLVRKLSGFCYLDENLQSITKSYFVKAEPFAGNHAAVGDKRGWTLIDRNGNSLSYPNFEAIRAVSRNFFTTGKLPLYGLYDKKGKLLIPVIYEQLNFLPSGYIQAVKEGEITYFRTNGTKLFD